MNLRQCIICNKPFQLKSKGLKQRVCNEKTCKYEAQKRRLKKWRQSNKDYFLTKDSHIIERWMETKSHWQQLHKNYWKTWREKNRVRYNNYLKKYRQQSRNKEKNFTAT